MQALKHFILSFITFTFILNLSEFIVIYMSSTFIQTTVGQFYELSTCERNNTNLTTFSTHCLLNPPQTFSDDFPVGIFQGNNLFDWMLSLINVLNSTPNNLMTKKSFKTTNTWIVHSALGKIYQIILMFKVNTSLMSLQCSYC